MKLRHGTKNDHDLFIYSSLGTLLIFPGNGTKSVLQQVLLHIKIMTTRAGFKNKKRPVRI